MGKDGRGERACHVFHERKGKGGTVPLFLELPGGGHRPGYGQGAPKGGNTILSSAREGEGEERSEFLRGEESRKRGRYSLSA